MKLIKETAAGCSFIFIKNVDVSLLFLVPALGEKEQDPNLLNRWVADISRSGRNLSPQCQRSSHHVGLEVSTEHRVRKYVRLMFPIAPAN